MGAKYSTNRGLQARASRCLLAKNIINGCPFLQKVFKKTGGFDSSMYHKGRNKHRIAACFFVVLGRNYSGGSLPKKPYSTIDVKVLSGLAAIF